MGDRGGEPKSRLGDLDDARTARAADSDFGVVGKAHRFKQLRLITGKGVELDHRSVAGAKDRQRHSGGRGVRSGQGGVSTISPCRGTEYEPESGLSDPPRRTILRLSLNGKWVEDHEP